MLLTTATSKWEVSARNVRKGRIIDAVKGATTAHVKMDVGGIVVTSSMTNAPSRLDR